MAVKPLSDRVLVKPVEREEMTKGGIYLPDTVKDKPQEGRVIAVGVGKRNENGDYELRPSLPPFTPCLPEYLQQNFDTNFLPSLIARYASIHLEHTALQSGDFSLALTRNRQLAFWRTNSEEQILVILNSDFESAHIEIESIPFGSYTDLLTGKHYHSDNFRGLELASCSVNVLKKN